VSTTLYPAFGRELPIRIWNTTSRSAVAVLRTVESGRDLEQTPANAAAAVMHQGPDAGAEQPDARPSRLVRPAHPTVEHNRREHT